MQPLCQKNSAGIVEEKKPHFLGVWEHRGVKIELYEDGEQLPFALLQAFSTDLGDEGSLTRLVEYPCNETVASLSFYRSHFLIIKTENEIIVFNCKKMAVRSTTPHKTPFINQTKRSGNTVL